MFSVFSERNVCLCRNMSLEVSVLLENCIAYVLCFNDIMKNKPVPQVPNGITRRWMLPLDLVETVSDRQIQVPILCTILKIERTESTLGSGPQSSQNKLRPVFR